MIWSGFNFPPGVHHLDPGPTDLDPDTPRPCEECGATTTQQYCEGCIEELMEGTV